MGLDIHAGKHHFSTSYWGFGDMRRLLASIEHLDLGEMQGFGGERPWTDDYESPSLTPLLNHSDCDGYLSGYQCGRVAARLRELDGAIRALPEAWLAEKVEELLPLLDFAADNCVALEFR